MFVPMVLSKRLCMDGGGGEGVSGQMDKSDKYTDQDGYWIVISQI
jgi:hypothetical protein